MRVELSSPGLQSARSDAETLGELHCQRTWASYKSATFCIVSEVFCIALVSFKHSTAHQPPRSPRTLINSPSQFSLQHHAPSTFSSPFPFTLYCSSSSVAPVVGADARGLEVIRDNNEYDSNRSVFAISTRASRTRPNMLRRACTPLPTARVCVSKRSTASAASSASTLKAGWNTRA